MNAPLSEDLKAERLQFMLEELGPSWTVTELQELLADLACEQDALLPTSPDAGTKPG